MEKLDLTILMPCLNEEKTIEKCIIEAKEFIKKHNIKGEILISDNKSTDNSIEIIKKHKVRYIIVNEKGYGNALKEGIIKSKGKYIIMGDSDTSYDFKNIKPIYDKLLEGYDLVMGNRFKGGIEKGAMPFLNQYIGNPFLSWLGKKLFPCNINDFHCGLRGFEREKMLKLKLSSPGMEFASEIVAKCVINNYKMCEIPIVLRKTIVDRKPHLRPLKDGFRHVKLLLVLKKKNK